MKKDPLFVTDAQIIERVGITKAEWETTLLALEKDGFPAPDPMFGNRRYWPACRVFLDRRYNLEPSSAQGNPALDGEERW